MTPSQIQLSATVRVCAKPRRKKNRSRQASENAPPAVVFHEEIAEMADRDREDRRGFQLVGVVNGVRHVRVSMRCVRRMHGVAHFCAQNLYLFSITRAVHEAAYHRGRPAC